MTIDDILFNGFHGRFGIELISDTGTHTANLMGYLATGTVDTVISSATGVSTTGNDWSTMTIRPGQYVPLPGCTALTLASGQGIGIKSPATTIPTA